MAAPAFAASMHETAISSGVIGSAGLCARVGNVPVTAHVRIVGVIEKNSLRGRSAWCALVRSLAHAYIQKPCERAVEDRTRVQQGPVAQSNGRLR
jgi:hypothetical protein